MTITSSTDLHRSLFSDLDRAYQRSLNPSANQQTSSHNTADRMICNRSTRNDSILPLEKCPSARTVSDVHYREALYSSLLGYSHPDEQRILASSSLPASKMPNPNNYRTLSGWSSALQEAFPCPAAPTLPHKKELLASQIYSYPLPRLIDNFYSNRIAYCNETDHLVSVSVDVSNPNCLMERLYLIDPFSPQGGWTAICDDPKARLRAIGCVAFHGSCLIMGTFKNSAKDPQAPPFDSIEYWLNDDDGIWKKCSEIKVNNQGTTSIVHSNDSITYAGGVNGTVSVIDTPNERIVRIYECGAQICNMVLSPSGRYLAVGLSSCKVKVIDLERKEFIASFSTKKASVRAIAFNPFNERQIAFGGGYLRPSLFLYDVEKQLLLHEKPMEQQFTGLFWTKDNVLVSTHNRGIVRFTPVRMNRPSNFLGESLIKQAPSSKRLANPCFVENPNGTSLLFASQGTINLENPYENVDEEHKILAFLVPQRPSPQAPSLLDMPLRV